MKEPGSTTSQEHTTQPGSGKRLHPLLLIGGIAIGGIVVWLIFVAAVIGMMPPVEPPKPVRVAEARMPDGTLLVLQAVTFGKSHKLQLPSRERRAAYWFSTAPAGRTL